MATARLDFDADFFPVRQLGLRAIKVDHDVQSRVRTDPEHVAKIVVFLRNRGPISEPVIVFFDGKDYWLADGFHRVEAHRQLSREKGFKKFGSIMAEIRPGTRRDAMVYSAGANQEKTYLKRSKEDIKRAIRMLLEDKEWYEEPNSVIAAHCGVGTQTVAKCRRSFCYSEKKILPRLAGAVLDGGKMLVRSNVRSPYLHPASADIPQVPGEEVDFTSSNAWFMNWLMLKGVEAEEYAVNSQLVRIGETRVSLYNSGREDDFLVCLGSLIMAGRRSNPSGPCRLVIVKGSNIEFPSFFDTDSVGIELLNAEDFVASLKGAGE